jgi:hypothetical protein
MRVEEIFTESPFSEFISGKGEGKTDNYGYLGDREQETLERLIDLIRITEIRNLGFPIGVHHTALGGKNFGHCLLMKYLIFGGPPSMEKVKVVLPGTKMLGATFYFTFLHHNPELQELLRAKRDIKGYTKADYREIQEAFRKARMPNVIQEELLVLLQKSQTEFYILRSSASCEDGKLPSAGLFDSLVYYDDRNGKTLDERLDYLEDVLKQVWASLFSPPAVSMMMRCGLSPLGESMSITFQPVIGDWYGDYFFPLISGVVKSTNTWPWGPEIRREDPVARIGFGMGTFMVGETGSYPEGGPRVFSLKSNGSMEQLVGEYLDPETTYATGGKPIARNDTPDNGQTKLDVLAVDASGRASIETREIFFDRRRTDNAQGIAAHIPSVLRQILASYHRVTDWSSGQSLSMEIYDAMDLPMRIRRGEFFDLGLLLRRVMDDLLAETRQSVSMEFAIRPVLEEGTDANGQPTSNLTYEFHLLQVRPQTTSASDAPIQLTALEPHHRLLAASTHAFGHMERTLSQAVVLSNEIVSLLGKARTQAFLRELDRTHRSDYLLIGPDAEEFVVGSSGFESLYSGLSPQAVISLKSRAGIHSLAGYSGSHAADNIERAPVIIQDAAALEPSLMACLEEIHRGVEAKASEASAEDLLVTGAFRVELDGNSGRGQVFQFSEETNFIH